MRRHQDLNLALLLAFTGAMLVSPLLILYRVSGSKRRATSTQVPRQQMRHSKIRGFPDSKLKLGMHFQFLVDCKLVQLWLTEVSATLSNQRLFARAPIPHIPM